ncbi:phosphotransferase [Frankia sp. Cppng1_Ct_nod]|uniref:phosphotransferase n=1 Tax=Frankia sp. Cppng1_Ct_nod TaxID=2897162 RepID=UPI00104123CA|nr:phosphotransferase [Frankia sp. Cppng1_Ct_nod]
MPRIHWNDLSEAIRSVIQEYTGPVLDADTASGGVNSGIAVTLCTPTQKIFVKGMPSDHRQIYTQQREAAINPYILHIGPKVLWRAEAGGWNFLGFEHIEGRHADYSPESPDLSKIAEVVRLLGQIPCPELPLKNVEQRWDSYADKPTFKFFAGDCLLHTDFAPHNMLIDSDGRAHLIDWAWPTRGPAWVDVAILIVRLIDAGHTPGEADAWSRQFSSWQSASVEAVNAFTVANYRMWQEIAQNDLQPWKIQMAMAAKRWWNHRFS